MTAGRPTRYAVLHHTGVPVPHFDVLVERLPGGDLATWRLPAWPVEVPTPVRQLADHRRVYLDHEGEVGGGRGRVDRVAGGTCAVAVEADGVWIVRLMTGAVGTLVLRPGASTWELSVT